MQSTPPIPIPHDEASLRWARGVLGVSDEALADEIRRLTLSRLEEMEFVPPAQWEQAILLLEEEPSKTLWQRDLGYEMHRAREVSLRQEVDQFAKEFFSMSPVERHTRWRELIAACEFSQPLTVWLEALSDGLGVVPPTSMADKDKLTNELAVYFLQTFPLPPTLRLAVDEELLQRAAFAPAQWQKAAIRLKNQFPEIAGLLSHLRDHLCQFVKVCRVEKKAESRRLMALGQASTGGKARSNKTHLTWAIPLVVVVLINLFRTLENSPRSSKPNYSRSYGNPVRSDSNNQIPNPPNAMPDMFRPIQVKILSPEWVPPPNLIKQPNVGEGFRRLLNIPADTEVYFGGDNTIYCRKNAPEMRIAPGDITPPDTTPNHGRRRVDLNLEEAQSKIDRVLNRPRDNFIPNSTKPTNPSPGPNYRGTRHYRPNVPNSTGGRPFP